MNRATISEGGIMRKEKNNFGGGRKCTTFKNSCLNWKRNKRNKNNLKTTIARSKTTTGGLKVEIKTNKKGS